MSVLYGIWVWFASNILTKPAYFIGLIVLIGYILQKKTWYDSLAGFIKATVGFLILSVGSGGLVSNFRPILVGLKDRFNLDAMVIDPYFGQNAVQSAMEGIGRSFSQVMFLLLIAFIFNLVLVKFNKITKLRAVFTTGHVQMQQAATAFWLILFCFPQLGDTPMLIIMSLILGLYWAVGSNLTVEISQDLTDGGGFCVAHQQMFGIAFFSYLSKKIFGNKKNSKRIEDIQLPGFMSIFNENMVSTAILMMIFFGAIMAVLGKDYFIETKVLKEGASFFMYVVDTSLKFAVYLAILQLGVRTFVTELTNSFQGISNTFLPGAVPGIDCAATYGFGSPNAVTIGFLFGVLGQVIAILGLIVFKSPVLIITGFVPVFFDNATFAVYANHKGGLRAASILTFLSGVIQVLGGAVAAGAFGLAAYGGWHGNFDWDTIWVGFGFLMQNFQYIGLGIVLIILLAIPQLQYSKNKEHYFTIAEDYETYLESKQN